VAATPIPPRQPTLLASVQWLLLALLALLTVGAWALTVYQARTMEMPMGLAVPGGVADGSGASTAPTGMAGMTTGAPATGGMAGMSAGTWTWVGLATFVAAWGVMMAAMMVPAATPMLLLFQRISAQRGAVGGGFVATWAFVAGYLLLWTAVAVPTWGLVHLASDLVSRVDPAARQSWAPLALGVTLSGAGLYQFTPLKTACLRHCQSPVGFVMTHWRDGVDGALRMGFVHGLYCLGCCWALFAVLVAVGVMSLPWMLLLTLVVFSEKVLPLGRRAPQVVGAAFVLLGLLVATHTVAMPWLV
jgi:predicted metal-binding membrane protein